VRVRIGRESAGEGGCVYDVREKSERESVYQTRERGTGRVCV